MTMAFFEVILLVVAVAGCIFPLGVARLRRRQIAASGIAEPVFWRDFPIVDTLFSGLFCILVYLVHNQQIHVDWGGAKAVLKLGVILAVASLCVFILLRVSGTFNHWFFVRNTKLQFDFAQQRVLIDQNGHRYQFAESDVAYTVERPFLSNARAPLPLGDFLIVLNSGSEIRLSRLQPGLEEIKKILKDSDTRVEGGAYFFIGGFLQKPVSRFLDFAGGWQLGKLALILILTPVVWSVNRSFLEDKQEEKALRPVQAVLHAVDGPFRNNSGRSVTNYYTLRLRYGGKNYSLNVSGKQYRKLGKEFYVPVFYNLTRDRLQVKSYDAGMHYFAVGGLAFIVFSFLIALIYRLTEKLQGGPQTVPG